MKNAILVFCLLVLSNLVNAAAVDGGNVTTFQNATVADATEMNTTIQALITAIDDNNSRIAALEASATTSVDGRSYLLEQSGVMLRGSITDDYSTIAVLGQTHTLAFGGGNTFTLVGVESEGELGVGTDAHGTMILQGDNDPVDISGTYVQSGETVTLSFSGGGTAVFKAALNGSVLLLKDFIYEPDETPTYTRAEVSFIVGIEIAP